VFLSVWNSFLSFPFAFFILHYTGILLNGYVINIPQHMDCEKRFILFTVYDYTELIMADWIMTAALILMNSNH
jgi:hypothetical protein